MDGDGKAEPYRKGCGKAADTARHPAKPPTPQSLAAKPPTTEVNQQSRRQPELI
jgi:hypothetical protein